MPFTAAHTVAVLPWVRKPRLSATALVVGTMTPDFEYFIRIGVKGVWGHDFLGIFLFDLPMAVAIVVVFHTIVKRNLIDNLPAFLQRRFNELRNLTLRDDMLARPVTFALCACAGAMTHVFWDGFTHQYGFFVQHLPSVYHERVVAFNGVDYPLWYALQQISTIFGMIVLVIYVIRMKPSESHIVKPLLWYWLVLVAFAALVAVVRMQFPHQPGLAMWAISAISGSCIGLIILGLLPAGKEIASTK